MKVYGEGRGGGVEGEGVRGREVEEKEEEVLSAVSCKMMVTLITMMIKLAREATCT